MWVCKKLGFSEQHALGTPRPETLTRCCFDAGLQSYPANTTHWNNVRLMLGRRRRPCYTIYLSIWTSWENVCHILRCFIFRLPWLSYFTVLMHTCICWHDCPSIGFIEPYFFNKITNFFWWPIHLTVWILDNVRRWLTWTYIWLVKGDLSPLICYE